MGISERLEFPGFIDFTGFSSGLWAHIMGTQHMATMRMAGLWQDPRTGVLMLRRRVPTRLRAAALASGHRGETLKVSLGTKDKVEALRRLPEALARFNKRLGEWEALANAVALTPEQACEITDIWADWIAGGNRLDTGGVSFSAFSPRFPEDHTQMVERLKVHAVEALRLAGISATPATTPLLIDAMRDKVQLAYMLADQQAANALPAAPVGTLPPLKRTEALIPPAASLRDLYSSWRAVSVAVLKPRTIEGIGYVIEMAAKFLGDDAAQFTRADLARWRDAMMAKGLSNSGWNNRLSMIRHVLTFGVSEGRLSADPTGGLRLRRNKTISPLPYSNADAVRILTAARQEARPSIRWSHWLMAFTGMRAGETLQLLGKDVRQEGNIWCIDINEHDPGKSVKTGVRRIVPIHEALIREGFIVYAQTIAPADPLFPDAPPDQHGNRGGMAWRAIGEWVRKVVGIVDAQKVPNHSWRHRMEDELRAVECPEDIRDAILGHARKTTGRGYGVRGEALARLHRHLSLVPCPLGLF